ncbi:MAG: hypothetical protein WB019_07900, partial [Pseudolabrys sp.]
REPAYTSLRLVRVIPAHASGQHLLGYAIVIGNRAAPPARRQLVDGAVLASIGLSGGLSATSAPS